MPSKREKIVQSALKRYRTHAICGTTLKDIAQASGVPLGGLYYYFKTRDDLVLAVLNECEKELHILLARLDSLEPASWLAGYFEWLLADPASAAQQGCPIGALAVELRALKDPAALRAAQTVLAYQQAVETRLQALPASASAGDVFLTVQGAYSVAHVLGDAGLFQDRMERLRNRVLGPADG